MTGWQRVPRTAFGVALLVGLLASQATSAATAAEAEAATETVPAGGAEIRLFELGREAGLPSVQVHSVAEDSQGLVWFATPAGLARFDGHHVTTYGQRDGLTTQGLRSLAAAGDGGLWIGSDIGVERRTAAGAVESVASSAERVTGIVEVIAAAGDGSLWIAAARGLRHVRPGGALEIPDGFGADEFVVSLAIDADGRVWFVTLESGLHRLAPDGAARLPLAAGDRRRALARRRSRSLPLPRPSRRLAAGERAAARNRRQSARPRRLGQRLDRD